MGGEIRKKRPAVIVSNNAGNRFLNRIQVVPLASSADRLYPNEAHVTFNEKRSKAIADQLTTISKKRLTNKTGKLSPTEMQHIAEAISVQLDP
uniref:mRNA interferase MazF n=1 Tax=Candidatus Kentrum sp. TC TaxID=2126339 RepID=A0A450YRG9_9GAMM|nr:MAG: mRNA interferase MazF [Candidatus Kentron sp. TC]